MNISSALILLLAVLTFFAAVFSPSHVVVAAAGLTLIFGLLLLWPNGQVPILVLPFALQWLEVAVKPIETAVLGQPLDDLADFNSLLAPGAYLGLASVAAMALGMRIASRGTGSRIGQLLAAEARDWPERSVVGASLAAIVLGHILDTASNYAGPARQIVGSLAGLQDAGLFILAYWCISQKRRLSLLAFVVALEIVVGFLGFFANFKGALLVLVLAAAAARPKLSPSSIAGVVTTLAVLMTAAVFWSSIKSDYRSFLNEKTSQQVALRPVNQRLEYVADQAGAFSSDRFIYGFQSLAERTSYIDFLSLTLEHVPLMVPFQGGKQTIGAIQHVLTPRILFPDKPETPNDTLVTEKYTGLYLDSSGFTSISIGYIGELYVDFGYPGAIIGSLGFGLFGGAACRSIMLYKRTPLLFNCGLAVMVAMQFAQFETALIKLLGSALMMTIVCMIFQRFALVQIIRVALSRRVPYGLAQGT